MLYSGMCKYTLRSQRGRGKVCEEAGGVCRALACAAPADNSKEVGKKYQCWEDVGLENPGACLQRRSFTFTPRWGVAQRFSVCPLEVACLLSFTRDEPS